MRYGSLTRILGGGALEADEVRICFLDPPEDGKKFRCIVGGPNPEDFQRIATSPALDVQTIGNVTTFATLSGSIYTLVEHGKVPC